MDDGGSQLAILQALWTGQLLHMESSIDDVLATQ